MQRNMGDASAGQFEPSDQSHAAGDFRKREPRTARLCAVAFMVCGLIGTVLLAFTTPPFQVADEPVQFMRAAQIADGGFIGSRFAQSVPDGTTTLTSGGAVDPALLKAVAPFNAMAFHPDIRAERADWVPNIYWSDARVLVHFQTANYPPFFYLPSAAGIVAGREFGLSVVQTLYLSRLLTGLVAVAIGALAIAIADGAAPWIFAILLLPMPLSLMASASQDALLIACAALAAALLVRGIGQPIASDGRLLTGLVITLSLVAMARPPFGALALLPLGLPQMRLWRRLLAFLAVVICTLAWARIAAITSLTNVGAVVGGDPAAQIQLIREHPLSAIEAIAATIAMWKAYLMEFIGVLGWLDTFLPFAYYRGATIMLIVAATAAMLGTKGKPVTAACYSITAAAIAIATLGVFVIQYVTWTVPGHPTVEGVEGRYFLAPALVGAALLPSLPRISAPRLRTALLALIVAFPIVTLAVTMRAIVLRYYLG
jgi:uncharacterized membrane protein